MRAPFRRTVILSTPLKHISSIHRLKLAEILSQARWDIVSSTIGSISSSEAARNILPSSPKYCLNPAEILQVPFHCVKQFAQHTSNVGNPWSPAVQV